ncbi:MAG: peroxiredoxin family protein [Bacteroidales bacterium]
MRSIFVCIICAALGVSTYAQECSIFATNTSYANKHIKIQSINNFICNEPTTIFETEVNKLGIINITVDNINTPTPAYINAGQNKVLVYLEPNTTLNLVLPNYEDLTLIQSKNPYFQATEVWAKVILPKKSLTDFVMKADIRYATVMAEYFEDLKYEYSDSLMNVATSIILDTEDADTKFKKDYLQYRKYMLEYALKPHKWQEFMRKYLNTELLINNSSFTSMLDEVFRNHIDAEISKNRDFISILNESKFSSIAPYIKDKYQLNENTASLIAIKTIYNGYYLNHFNRPKCIEAAKYLSMNTKNTELRKIATETYEKIYHLSINSPAPKIELKDIYGEKISLGDFDKSKMLIIHFTDIDLYTAKQEIGYLNTMTVGMDDFLETLYLFKPGNSPDSIANFVKQYDIRGQFAVCTDNIATKYRVASWPTTYLLNESNRLIASPAPNPMGGLDRTLKEIVKKKQIDKMRQEGKEPQNNSFKF